MNYHVRTEDAMFRINLEELRKEYLDMALSLQNVLRNDLLFNEPTRVMQQLFPNNLQYRFQVAMDQILLLPYNEPNSGEGWKRALMARILNDDGLAAMISDLQAEAARRATRRTVNRGNAYRIPAELKLNTTATENNNNNKNNETTGGATVEAPRPGASAVPEVKPYQARCESVDGDEEEDVN